MRVYSAEETRNMLPFGALIEALREMFRAGAAAPLRHHHAIPLDGQPDATLLLMPAWTPAGLGGVKIVNVNPGNAAIGMPALSSSYLLFDACTGRHLAMLDGGEITNRRTAAVSALAASYLARADARRLLVVGAGRVAGNLADAFRAVRPIEDVAVWDIDAGMAEGLARRLNGAGFRAAVTTDLEAAVADADIVSCATLATEPLIAGAWLRPGQHLDLIGSFRPGMREADDAAVSRARVHRYGGRPEGEWRPHRTDPVRRVDRGADRRRPVRPVPGNRGRPRRRAGNHAVQGHRNRAFGSGGGDSRPHETRGRGMTGGPGHAHPRVLARVHRGRR